MDKRNYAFDKTNFILLAVGMLVVILGFILMSGAGSDESVFNNDIFSVRRTSWFVALRFYHCNRIVAWQQEGEVGTVLIPYGYTANPRRGFARRA